MVVHAQNPRTQGAEAGDFHKFKASLQDRETLSRSKQQQQQNIKPRPDASERQCPGVCEGFLWTWTSDPRPSWTGETYRLVILVSTWCGIGPPSHP